MSDRLIHLVDTSLRDGMNTVGHQFTPEQVGAIARGLDKAGVGTIEVAHGDGIGGSSIQFGRAAAADAEYVAAAVDAVEDASIAVLYVPGIATLTDLQGCVDAGIGTVRVAVHCTEADCAQQPITWAREHGLTVMSFLMMSHMLPPDRLAEQAALLDAYGAHVVYVVDSAGALVPDTAAERVAALRGRIGADVGFHAHNNLGVGVGNALAAVTAGATYVDGSLRGLGAGAGNAQTEVLAAALERAGHTIDADLFALLEAAEHVVAPLMRRPQVIDETAVMIGYAGVYSTFFHFAKRAGEKYGVPTKEIIVELGRRGVIGGQEDMIVDVAAEMAGMLEPAE